MFTVVWTNRALDKLADRYVGLDLSNQDRLAAEINALNHRLHRDPSEEVSPGPRGTGSPLSKT